MVTSLADFFSMENPYSKLFSGIKFFVCYKIFCLLTDFQIFWHLLKTWNAKWWYDNIFLEVFQKRNILQNAVSGRWCIDSSRFTCMFFNVNSHNFLIYIL